MGFKQTSNNAPSFSGDCCTKAICFVAAEFGLGHVREYATFGQVGLGALRAPCLHPQRLASHPLCKVSAHLLQM